MERSLTDIKYNYDFINEKIAEAAMKAGKTRDDITFLSATKTVEPEYINYAISLGLSYIGENKVQELLSKYDQYNLENCSLQFIGHLQSNKVRQIVGKVDLIQSIDSMKLAKEVSKCSLKNNITSDILVEVNIGKEENKSGVMPEMLEELVEEISTLPAVNVKGLMTIPPICEKKDEIRRYFEKMNRLFLDISSKKLDNVSMDILSMGMSSDYYEAILEGANMVRIGSALFGNRIYKFGGSDMAGFVDKIKRMWDSPDDEYEYDDYSYEDNNKDSYDDEDSYEEQREHQREVRRSERSERRRYTSDSYTDSDSGNKVVNINASTKIQVILFKPERFGDETRGIADEINKNRTVVLNLEDTNKDMSRRIIDFLSGVTYAKKGKIKKIANATFIIMPENVDFTGDDLLGELENNGVIF